MLHADTARLVPGLGDVVVIDEDLSEILFSVHEVLNLLDHFVLVCLVFGYYYISESWFVYKVQKHEVPTQL